MLRNAQQTSRKPRIRRPSPTLSTMSTAAEDDKDYVKAYEVLADLTRRSRKRWPSGWMR